MSKVIRKAFALKKTAQNIDHSAPLRVTIPAGMANPKPPLGSQLAQRNINIANFVQEFNERTANIKDGIPIPCRIKAQADGTYNLVMHNPPATYFLKQAAGTEKGRVLRDEVAGKITFKHLYEIACIKGQDPPLALLNLQQVCQMLVGIARTCGIQIVHSIDPEEHAEYIKQRDERRKEHYETLLIAKQATPQKKA